MVDVYIILGGTIPVGAIGYYSGRWLFKQWPTPLMIAVSTLAGVLIAIAIGGFGLARDELWNHEAAVIYTWSGLIVLVVRYISLWYTAPETITNTEVNDAETLLSEEKAGDQDSDSYSVGWEIFYRLLWLIIVALAVIPAVTVFSMILGGGLRDAEDTAGALLVMLGFLAFSAAIYWSVLLPVKRIVRQT